MVLLNLKTKHGENVNFLSQAIDKCVHSDPIWICKLKVHDKSTTIETIVQWYSIRAALTKGKKQPPNPTVHQLNQSWGSGLSIFFNSLVLLMCRTTTAEMTVPEFPQNSRDHQAGNFTASTVSQANETELFWKRHPIKYVSSGLTKLYSLLQFL